MCCCNQANLKMFEEVIIETACIVIEAWHTDKCRVPKVFFRPRDENWKLSAQCNLSKSFHFIPNYLSLQGNLACEKVNFLV